MNPIEAGKEALEAIVQPLREEKTRLLERIATINVTLKPLEAALSPLGRRGGRPAKPKDAPRTVTQDDVRAALEELTTAKPGIAQTLLLEKAKHALKVQHGLDLKGFANRCREVLGSKPFVVDEAGRVRLVEDGEEPMRAAEAALRRADPQSIVDNFALGAVGS